MDRQYCIYKLDTPFVIYVLLKTLKSNMCVCLSNKKELKPRFLSQVADSD